MALISAHLNAETILVTVYRYSLPLPPPPGISGPTSTSLETTPRSTNQPTNQPTKENSMIINVLCLRKRTMVVESLWYCCRPSWKHKNIWQTERCCCWFYTSPSVWNSLPQTLLLSDSSSSFKTALFLHLLDYRYTESPACKMNVAVFSSSSLLPYSWVAGLLLATYFICSCCLRKWASLQYMFIHLVFKTAVAGWW